MTVARRRWPSRFRKALSKPAPPVKYIFGSGSPIVAKKRVIINHPLLGDAHVDVVPGKLPFLIGRKMLKRAKISINFEHNFIESAQQASSKLRQSGSAYLISLKDTEQLIQRIGASGKSISSSSTGRDDERSAAQCQEVATNTGGEKIELPATAGESIASSAALSGTERAVRKTRPNDSFEEQSGKNEN